MGLPDRLKAYQQEQIAKQAAEAEVARKTTEVQGQESERISLEAVRYEAEERRRILSELNPLLEVIQAREQLEELRNLWNTGEVDTEPRTHGYYGGIRNPAGLWEKYPGASLTYSYRYWSVAEGGRPPLEASDYLGPSLPSCVIDRSNEYIVVVRKIPEPSFYVVSHTSNNSPWQAINLNNPTNARNLLTDALLDVYVNSPQPQKIISDGKNDIIRHGLPLPKPLLSWYRRILG